jgi:hypothetical protein
MGKGCPRKTCAGYFLHRPQLTGSIVRTLLFFARMKKVASTGEKPNVFE